VNVGRRPRLGQRVVVVGGGNTAMDCARTAARLGAKVVVLYRRSREEMPAIADEVREAEREGVHFLFLAAPVGAVMAQGALAGLRCRRMKLGEPDASGRRRPVPRAGSDFFLAADTVLSAIGESADLEFLPPSILRNEDAVIVDDVGGTNVIAVFAGGDAVEQPRSVAHALGAGKRAAIGMHGYLSNEGFPTRTEMAALRLGPSGNVSITRRRGDDPVRRAAPVNEVVTPERINPAHFARVPRHEDRHTPVRGSFAETNLGLTSVEALAEARRCLNCGVCNGCEVCLTFCPDLAISRRDRGGFAIALEYCKGCGLCAAECPRGAVRMVGVS
jgi:Pyruvate/2-oxoacid:ferredoxin oxidoreductase delta subunit